VSFSEDPADSDTIGSGAGDFDVELRVVVEVLGDPVHVVAVVQAQGEPTLLGVGLTHCYYRKKA